MEYPDHLSTLREDNICLFGRNISCLLSAVNIFYKTSLDIDFAAFSWN